MKTLILKRLQNQNRHKEIFEVELGVSREYFPLLQAAKQTAQLRGAPKPKLT